MQNVDCPQRWRRRNDHPAGVGWIEHCDGLPAFDQVMALRRKDILPEGVSDAEADAL